MLAQQSALPSIPKSGLTTPCKDWEIWDWGLDRDRSTHVLLDPNENDVITRERRRDKEILLIVFQMPRTMCYSGDVIVKS